MKIEIKFDVPITLEDSYALEELQDVIEDETDFTVNPKTEFVEGTRGDVTIALDVILKVIPIVLSSITTVLTAITFWKNQQKEKGRAYTATIRIEGTNLPSIELTETGISQESAEALLDTLMKHPDSKITVDLYDFYESSF